MASKEASPPGKDVIPGSEAPDRPQSHRSLPGSLLAAYLLLTLMGVGVSVVQIFGITPGGIVMWPRAYFSALIACFLPLIFLSRPHRKGATRVPWFDVAAVFACIACAVYFIANTTTIEYSAWEYFAPTEGKIAAAVFCVLVLEAARRTAGTLFFAVCTFFFAFPLFTDRLPGLLQGIGFTPEEAILYYVYGLDSLFGLVMDVMGNLLIGFLIFAVTLNYTGGGRFFLNLASALVGGSRGGPAKIAVVSSGFFGSMSGDVVSNVVSTGSVTIPAMKKLGYPSHYAGAVEACSSTGGVLMPPVMGATAFMIAQILGIPYAEVAAGALIPAVLYYFSLIMQVDSAAVKAGLKGLPKGEIPSVLQTSRDGWPYLFGLGFLVFELFYLRTAALAPYYASAALLVTVIVWKWRSQSRQQWLRYIEAIGDTVSTILPMLLGVGFIIGALTTTGIASSFSREVIDLAGGNPALLLILGAVVSFVLGMGMTISAVYIFLAMTMAPPLVAMGFDPLAVHLFVMYCAMTSFITPPVALAAFAGSALAGAPPTKTGFTAMRMGFVLYLIPFGFVVAPALVLHGPLAETLWLILTSILGICLAVAGIEGYVIGLGYQSSWRRVLGIVGGLLLIIPEGYSDIVGLAIGVLLVFPALASAIARTGKVREVAAGPAASVDNEQPRVT